MFVDALDDNRVEEAAASIGVINGYSPFEIAQDKQDIQLPIKAIGSKIVLPNYEENPYVKMALRFAAPDLDIRDYVPNYDKSSIIGQASNQTLGTFPIFSAAVVAPSTFAKRKKAIADYILNLEQLKAQNVAKATYPGITAAPADADWQKDINDYGITAFEDLVKKSRDTGIPIANADKGGHPMYGDFQRVQNYITSLGKLTEDVQKRIDAAETQDLNNNTSLAKETRGLMEWWRYMSTNPELRKGLVESGKAFDEISKINNKIESNINLIGLVSPELKNIDKYVEGSGPIPQKGTANYDLYMLRNLEGYEFDDKGNLKKDLKGSPRIHEIAMNIAKQKPYLFKDKDLGGSANAPFSVDDVERYIREYLGYKDAKEYMIAYNRPQTQINMEQKRVDAVPQAVEMLSNEMSKNSKFVVDKDNYMLPGDNFVTFVLNGELKVVPKANNKEILRNMLLLGSKDSKFFGDVDASEAYANNIDNKALLDIINQKSGGQQESVSYNKDASFQVKNNSAIKGLAGDNGVPVTNGVFVRSIVSLSPSKDDSKFYFNARVGDSNSFSTGIVIPNSYLDDTKTASGFVGTNNRVLVPVGGDSKFIENAYYKLSKDGKSYAVYSKDSDSEIFVGGTPIKLPIDYVRNMGNKGISLVDEANKKYPSSGINDNSPKVEYNTNKAAKGGSGNSSVVTSFPEGKYKTGDNEVKIAGIVLANKYNGITSTQEAIDYVNKIKTDSIDVYNKLLKAGMSLDVNKVRNKYGIQ